MYDSVVGFGYGRRCFRLVVRDGQRRVDCPFSSRRSVVRQAGMARVRSAHLGGDACLLLPRGGHGLDFVENCEVGDSSQNCRRPGTNTITGTGAREDQSFTLFDEKGKVELYVRNMQLEIGVFPMTRMIKCLMTFLMLCVAALAVMGCYSPSHSQEYFVQASKKDPALEPLYSTALYTVYYDHALVRCIVHSSHTWGQSGGGGGGTGIGIHAFRCDPNRIRQRAQAVGIEVYPPRMIGPLNRPALTGTGVDSTQAAPAAKQPRTVRGQSSSGVSPRPPQVAPPAAGGAQ